MIKRGYSSFILDTDLIIGVKLNGGLNRMFYGEHKKVWIGNKRTDVYFWDKTRQENIRLEILDVVDRRELETEE